MNETRLSTSEEFLSKLFKVVYKLSITGKSQSKILNLKWNEYLGQTNNFPYLVRRIPLKMEDKERFLTDIDFRINILKITKRSIIDGILCIKSLLQTLYNSYFNGSMLFKSDFSEEDQLVLKYLVAKEILSNLIQYNAIDHSSVPMKYNIIASNYLLLKLKGLEDVELLNNLKKIYTDIEISFPIIHIIMEEIEKDGIINIIENDGHFTYKLNKELKLSDDGKKTYEASLRYLISWPTRFYREYYDIRELNISMNEEARDHEILTSILKKATTQGYAAALHVFKSLVKYHRRIKSTKPS